MAGAPRMRMVLLAAVLALGAGCDEPRRPTPEEIEAWDRSADVTLTASVAWELLALVVVALGVWDIIRRRRGRSPNWPRSVGILMVVIGGIMLAATADSFARLWTA